MERQSGLTGRWMFPVRVGLARDTAGLKVCGTGQWADLPCTPYGPGHGHGKATYHNPGLDGQEAGTVDEIIVSDLHNIVERLRQNRMLLGFLPWV